MRDRLRAVTSLARKDRSSRASGSSKRRIAPGLSRLTLLGFVGLRRGEAFALRMVGASRGVITPGAAASTTFVASVVVFFHSNTPLYPRRYFTLQGRQSLIRWQRCPALQFQLACNLDPFGLALGEQFDILAIAAPQCACGQRTIGFRRTPRHSSGFCSGGWLRSHMDGKRCDLWLWIVGYNILDNLFHQPVAVRLTVRGLPKKHFHPDRIEFRVCPVQLLAGGSIA